MTGFCSASIGRGHAGGREAPHLAVGDVVEAVADDDAGGRHVVVGQVGVEDIERADVHAVLGQPEADDA